MKSYCIKCLKEKEMIIDSTTDDKDRKEIKVEGRCKKCNEYLCRIIIVD